MNPFRIIWDFWTVPIRAESLAMFRIFLGCTIILAVTTGMGSKLVHTCGEQGVCPAEACDGWLESTGRFCVLRGPISTPILGDWLPDDVKENNPRFAYWTNRWVSAETEKRWGALGARPEPTYVLFVVYLGSLVAVVLGWNTRLMTLVALILGNSFNFRLSWLMNGGDSLFRNGLYFLLLSPAGAVWSLDHLYKRRMERLRAYEGGLVPEDKPVLIPPWSVRLMQLQVCMIYLFTGLVKTGDDPWVLSLFGMDTEFDPDSDYPYRGDYFEGVALYWVMNDITITRWPYCLLPVPFFVCRLLSWLTLIFEIGFSFFVLIKPLRPYLLLGGLALHLGIMVLLEIGWFSQVMMCWYILFVPGEQVAGFFQRWGRWWGGEPASRDAVS